jgi:plasmid stability protein
MANLTLSLEDSLLQQAREAALRDHTSVNALVRDYLTQYVNAKRRRLDAVDAFDAIAARSHSRSEAGWARDDLHER